MIAKRIQSSFESWRDAARSLLQRGVEPDQIVWTDDCSPAEALSFGEPEGDVRQPAQSRLSIPHGFLEQAQLAACYRDPSRWALLYRIAFRLTHGEPNLMSIVVDDDITRLRSMAKAVSRDRHKMTAFVRFREIVFEGVPQYIAFHRPDHYIVRLASSFFVERFRPMHWAILTPDESVSWDTRELSFGPGVSSRDGPQEDSVESLWLTYYRSIFNPARLKVKHMIQELPVRHWKTLPEAALIPDLIRSAGSRSQEMQVMAAKRTQDVAPVPDSTSLRVLEEASRGCLACEWARKCTQTVFGNGPKNARIVLVGEQPGDIEDQKGEPFVGPAGQMLRSIIKETGFDASTIYLTNAVKHFKFEPRGTRRIHQTPSARDVSVCKPWLEAELKAIKPDVLVCLGATAAKSIFGHGFRITQSRGEWIESEWCPNTLASWHPSAILRVPDRDAADAMRSDLLKDLQKAFKKVA
jgi:DNA polymerase